MLQFRFKENAEKSDEATSLRQEALAISLSRDEIYWTSCHSWSLLSSAWIFWLNDPISIILGMTHEAQ